MGDRRKVETVTGAPVLGRPDSPGPGPARTPGGARASDRYRTAEPTRRQGRVGERASGSIGRRGPGGRSATGPGGRSGRPRHRGATMPWREPRPPRAGCGRSSARPAADRVRRPGDPLRQLGQGGERIRERLGWRPVNGVGRSAFGHGTVLLARPTPRPPSRSAARGRRAASAPARRTPRPDTPGRCRSRCPTGRGCRQSGSGPRDRGR